MTVENLLAQARSRLDRLEPEAAGRAMAGGAVLVDIRVESQRAADGVVPDALYMPRNVLEWRCDPASQWHDERIEPGAHVIVMCNEGCQSSLAAGTLCDLGLDATDMVGGFQAWRAAGLPVQR